MARLLSRAGRGRPREACSRTRASDASSLGAGTCSSCISLDGNSNAANPVGDAADKTPPYRVLLLMAMLMLMRVLMLMRIRMLMLMLLLLLLLLFPLLAAMQPPTSSSTSACGKKLTHSAIRLIISRSGLLISTRRPSARYESEIMLGKKQHYSRRVQQQQLRRRACRTRATSS
eukprot:2773225-Pleurochrysis_carterae.AAC.1